MAAAMTLAEQGASDDLAPPPAPPAAAAAGVTPDVIMEIASGETVRETVAKGHGIGIFGELALPSDPRLKVLHFADAEMPINRYLACLRERRNEFLVDAFFKVAGISH